MKYLLSPLIISLIVFGIYTQVKIDPRELKVGDCINGFSLPVIEDGLVYGYKRSMGVPFKIKEIKANYYILTPLFDEWEKTPKLADWDVYITKEDFKHGNFHQFGFRDNKMCVLREDK